MKYEVIHHHDKVRIEFYGTYLDITHELYKEIKDGTHAQFEDIEELIVLAYYNQNIHLIYNENQVLKQMINQLNAQQKIQQRKLNSPRLKEAQRKKKELELRKARKLITELNKKYNKDSEG